MRLSIPITLAICGLSLAASPVGHALEFEQYPALRYFSAEMTEKHGFSLNQLEKTFQCARIRPEIVSAMERPKELLPWYEYKKIFLTDENVRRGVEFWKKHAEVLARAQKQYGVSPEIVIAILGVETHFGRNLGNYPILDALATLMLDYPPRSAFFRQELAEFLLLTRELDINPCELKGSYAGAMGLPQFIPSSYRQYAVDFDADGRRNLLSSSDDAIGSIGHYLKKHGWEAGAPLIEDVHLEGTLYFWIEKLGLKPALPVSQLTNYGIFPRRMEHTSRRAALVSFEGEYGPYYRLGYNNFYVITRYNHSKQYALAVYELSEMIRKRAEQS